MAQETILTKERLGYYDSKLKAWVNAADAEILKQANAHAESLADNYDPAGTAQTKVDELANGQVKTNKEAIEAINNEETGILKQSKDYADGKDSAIAEAKKAGTDAQATANKNAEDITALQGRMTTAEGDIDNVEADMGDVDSLSTTNKTVVGAINEVLAAVGTGGTAAVVTVTTDTTSDGALKSYTIKQGSTTVGVIDIPKDMVVEAGEVVTNPEGQAEGTYIKLTLANVVEPLYINVGTLVDIYKAKANATQVQLTIDSASREISAVIVASSITSTELADSAVITAKIADANVTKAKLSTAVQASLDKADVAAPQTALDEEVNRAKGAEAQVLTDAKAYADSKVEGVDLSGIATNASDIDKLEASLAEGGATANAIADAKKAGTDAQSEVDALEEKVGEVAEGKTVVQMIADAQTAATYDDTDVKSDISANADAIAALEEKVGEGYTVITEADIDAMFPTA